MREILFKAKRKDNGEWVQGYLFDDGMPKPKRYFIGGIIIKPYEGTACDKWNVVGIDFCEIDIDTLCQYTGLTDKNGKRIWENDIAHIRSSGLSGYGVIKYENGNLVLVDSKRKRTYSMYGEWKIRKDGNIFDNADLLEVE